MLISEIPAWLIRASTFVFGALWGSFFNVAIYRWPREMSVVYPPSHCPTCGTSIPPHRNIPIFGYLWMRGRTQCCQTELNPRYLVVEILGALLCLAVAERFMVQADPQQTVFNAVIEAFCYFVFAGGLLIATFTDLEDMQIPDEVSLPGAALGLISVELRTLPGAVDAAIGAGLGFLGIQMLFVWGYELAFGRRGMGEGDSKLLLMIGAFIGWQGVLFTLLAASVQGLIAYLISQIVGIQIGPRYDEVVEVASEETPAQQDEITADNSASTSNDQDEEEPSGPMPAHIPYGPFLSIAALEYLFFHEQLMAWYQDYFAF